MTKAEVVIVQVVLAEEGGGGPLQKSFPENDEHCYCCAQSSLLLSLSSSMWNVSEFGG